MSEAQHSRERFWCPSLGLGRTGMNFRVFRNGLGVFHGGKYPLGAGIPLRRTCSTSGDGPMSFLFPWQRVTPWGKKICFLLCPAHSNTRIRLCRCRTPRFFGIFSFPLMAESRNEDLGRVCRGSSFPTDRWLHLPGPGLPGNKQIPLWLGGACWQMRKKKEINECLM